MLPFPVVFFSYYKFQAPSYQRIDWAYLRFLSIGDNYGAKKKTHTPLFVTSLQISHYT